MIIFDSGTRGTGNTTRILNYLDSHPDAQLYRTSCASFSYVPRKYTTRIIQNLYGHRGRLVVDELHRLHANQQRDLLHQHHLFDELYITINPAFFAHLIQGWQDYINEFHPEVFV